MNPELLRQFSKVDDVVWELPKTFKHDMQVPARIYGTPSIMKDMDDTVVDQLTNVACLPGIQKHAYCMADGHSGYGFPIGGVAAFDPDKGVISPGGIGFDINCGMRLIKTNLKLKDVQPKIKQLVDTLFKMVPAGVGGRGFVRMNPSQMKDAMQGGAKWCVEQGYGWESDIGRIEDFGAIDHADPAKVSQKALGRGINQLGTLGSGNHYLEVQTIRKGELFDAKAAKRFGLEEGQVVVMVHCGSRGFGHQIATDYLNVFGPAMKSHGITVRDPELACAPFRSKEGQAYFHAMACAANSAFANRQVITHQIREAFKHVFKEDPKELGMELIYDVAHNIAKLEKHKLNGKNKEVLVHRKGATRCFGPGRAELAPLYRDLGQPVIVGGSMETGSYLLLGTKKAEEETFGSTMHGSGRTMSRTQAKHAIRGEQLQKDMEKRGIYVRTTTFTGLAEEAGFAYKDISEVVRTMEIAGISKPVCALRPIGNVKG
ncbi:RtcB family protein [Candidatus Woesearchaeota archaeon]|nr:RtcB family protein [Candidatus Woesearchaeota archaeon]